jgi:hypothetical protein
MTNRILQEDHLLRIAYRDMRRAQARSYGHTMTDLDHAVSDVIYNVSKAAMLDVRNEAQNVSMRAVALSTGTGKTLGSCAFIAAAKLLVPKFTAAYIAPTVPMAVEVQENIERLTGEGSTVLWSSLHKHKGVEPDVAMRRLGYVPDRLVNRAHDLTNSRIIIVTQKAWVNEMKAGRDMGIRFYQGQRRDILFVDEHPDLVDIIPCLPSDVLRLHDELHEHDPKHPWVSTLSTVAGRMANLMNTTGQRYEPSSLLTGEDSEPFVGSTHGDVLHLSNDKASAKKRTDDAKARYRIVEFIQSAATGAAFYSRQDRAFFAYRMDYEPGAGHVLLDATSDITGLVKLRPDVEQIKVPEVTFENLEIVHVKQPKNYQHVKKACENTETGEKYGTWIKATTLKHTQEGDNVLIITHKAVVDMKFLDVSRDPDSPTDWDGRKVVVQTWGDGIGLNKFKHCNVVCSFSEFHIPRSTTISHTHGWNGKKPTKGRLKKAEGVRKSGSRYSPQGDYALPHDGNLLRWNKQLAMRGSARNINADGSCGEMKWVTSMDRGRLLENLELMFPGAPLPVAGGLLHKGARAEAESGEKTGREGLIDLLMARDKTVVGADEIQRATGIIQSKLGREIDSQTVKPVAEAYGWHLVSAKEIGRAGRMRYLVNDKLLLQEQGAA